MSQRVWIIGFAVTAAHHSPAVGRLSETVLGVTDRKLIVAPNPDPLMAKSVGGGKAIENAPYFGWSWLEWGGVGLARLQNADFEGVSKTATAVSC